ncbi:MAG: DNA polymerase IV [Methylococcaceae bacterium]|nr:DNA polymerase IV [Methylococcaceae bacterium]
MDVPLPQRKIIHVDMDAFYAAVEQRDFPQYRGLPVVVGGAPDSRGVVSTASYEARRFGIRSAMPAAHAYRLCPEAVFLRPRFEAYREASRQVREILLRYTGLVEFLSLDEAFLDVSGCSQFQGSATLIAQDIKQRVREITGLTVSAGVSYNKFLAKIASDLEKPDGLCLITPKQAPGFIEKLPIGRFHGVGKATEARMAALGIATGGDLRAWDRDQLVRRFGKAGHGYYLMARGIDERPVVADRARKSLGAELTFASDSTDLARLLAQLRELAEQVLAELGAKGLQARTLTVKIKYGDFTSIGRSKTMRRAFGSGAELLPHLDELLEKTEAGSRPVRLVGVTLSGLEEVEVDGEAKQRDLFG